MLLCVAVRTKHVLPSKDTWPIRKEHFRVLSGNPLFFSARMSQGDGTAKIQLVLYFKLNPSKSTHNYHLKSHVLVYYFGFNNYPSTVAPISVLSLAFNED